jgi:hypothetical protein
MALWGSVRLKDFKVVQEILGFTIWTLRIS